MLLIYKNWISDVTKTWFTEDITKFGSACMAYPGDVHVNRWKIGWFMYLWKQNMPHESDYPKIGVKIWHFIIKDGKSLNKICANSFIISGSSKWHNSALIFPWSLLSQLFVPSQQFPFAGPRHTRESPTVYPNVAGTSFLYHQHQNGVTFSEKLTSKGPTNTEIEIMVTN